MKELITLFKAVKITAGNKSNIENEAKIHAITIPKGFMLTPEVISGYKGNLTNLITIIEGLLSLSAKQLNATFHKSWDKIANASQEQLVVEQLMHYITTYGYKALGIYDEDTVYIPDEVLEIPELKIGKIKLVVIKGLTTEEIRAKLLEFVNSGVALKTETVEAVMTLFEDYKLTIDEINAVKNKEVKTRLYGLNNMVPESPVEFLRYFIFKTTQQSLIIKNPKMIALIKASNPAVRQELLTKYKSMYGLKNLAHVFNRYKPLFLAMKHYDESMSIKMPQVSNIINNINRLSKKHHKPMKSDLLNDLTALIKTDKPIGVVDLGNALKKANTFRKIRLAYALKYRTIETNAIMYRVRNGKAYAKGMIPSPRHLAAYSFYYNKTMDSIREDLAKNVKGKKIKLPNNVKYALPSTEKQFVGNVPAGTCVEATDNMLVGVHWKNVEGHSTDLDLASFSIKSGKIGWDGDYRNSDRSVLFSGDITDAPNGATEVFYVQKQADDVLVLTLNYYSFRENTPVPFSLFVAQDEVNSLKKNHMIDPNTVLATANMSLDVQQKVLGILVTSLDTNKFYFTEAAIGRGISSSDKPYIQQTKQYLVDYYSNAINLNALLVEAGAIVDEAEEYDIDLSLESLDKTTIIDLFKKA